MKKAGSAALTTGAAVANGMELAGQVSATAAEMLRTRRDPAVQAQKKRRAAKRRLAAWSAGAVVSGAVAATGTVEVIQGDNSGGAIGAMVFLVAILIWCIVGVIRASVDLRARNRVIAALPAVSPARPAVAGEIRPEMARLDGYSDGLRQLVGMIGIVDGDPSMRQLRDEILSAADVSEARIRQQAMDLTGLLKARRSAPPAAAQQLDPTVDSLRRHVRDGVAGYGELVSAVSETVAASRQLSDQQAHPHAVSMTKAAATDDPALHPELDQPIQQLRSLAAGMRELTQG